MPTPPHLLLPFLPTHRGIPAASIAFNSVLAACEAAKELEAGLEVLQEMRAAGVPGDQYTYSTLISCCQVGTR
jgi:pentatricopeptide repeat protein